MTKFALPVEAYGDLGADGRPKVPLEFVHSPMYSAIALNNAALPRELSFFTYTTGGTVAGAGGGAIAASKFHTNSLLANAIPRPKTFTCLGIRFLLSPLDYTSGAPAVETTTATATFAAINMVNDFFGIMHSTAFSLRQGEIEEVLGPIGLMPGNVGLGGAVGTSANATGTADTIQHRISLTTLGKGWSLRRRPFVLWNQQFFEAKLTHDWGTVYTVLGDRYLFCILDGIQGREYQG